MDRLTQLAVKYGTDKHGKHNYIPHYNKLFKELDVKKLLEIGVGEGKGLMMFEEFLPNTKIYGAEIEENRCFEDGRIKVVQCDQTSREDLVKLVDETGFNVDLVIDDGSHKLEDQIFTCRTLMTLFNMETVYVIEDVAHTNIVKAFDDYDCELIECGDRYDDRLLIVRNK